MQMMNITLDEEKLIYHKWSSYKTANDNVYFHDSWLSIHVGPVRHDDVIKWRPFPRYWLSKASDAEVWCFRWSVPE